VNALSVALYPMLSADPPADMIVVIVAWGPAPPDRFEIDGHSTQDKEENVWVSTAPVRSSEGDQASLDSNLVPFTIYAPGNAPSVMVIGSSAPLPVPGASGYPPTVTPIAQIVIPQPVPTFVAGMPPSGISLSPYADFTYRLPSGLQPQSLYLRLNTGNSTQAPTRRPSDVLAFNVQTGTWDNIATLSAQGAGWEQAIPNPSSYVGRAGDVTIRLRSSDGTSTNLNGILQLALNSTK
jgi:hypothetical protein